VEDDALTECIAEVIGIYLDQLEDPGEVDAGELAENIAIQLRRMGR